MSTLKASIKKELIEKQILMSFSGFHDLRSITDGELSQAFSFRSDNNDYIIRVNTSLDGFMKDEFAYKNFSTKDIPIPKILEIGKITNELFYCFSEKAKGISLKHMSSKEIFETLPSIQKTLHAIHKSKIPDKSRFGGWNQKGIGEFNTWKEDMLTFDSDFLNWNEINQNTFMEESLYKYLTSKIKDLIAKCPEERFLVHGDYGFDNVLVEDNNITAIIDWNCSRYGDFLYDIGYMHFWSEVINYKEVFYKIYEEHNIEIEHYDERILCYCLRVALIALGFFSKSNQKDSYEWVKERLKNFINL